MFRYPLRARHPEPLNALRAEIRRRRAAGAQRIGLIGFSAGGHLAGLAALAPGAPPDEAVDFAVLGYAITSMETETYRPARVILLGEDAGPELRRSTSLDSLVTPQSPPLFVWHTAEDPLRPRRTHLPPCRGARGRPSPPRRARVRARPAQSRPRPERRRGRDMDHACESLDPRTGVTVAYLTGPRPSPAAPRSACAPRRRVRRWCSRDRPAPTHRARPRSATPRCGPRASGRRRPPRPCR